MAENMENVKRLEKFFTCNLKIKEELVRADPNNYIDFISASNSMLNCINDISFYFEQIFVALNYSEDEQIFVRNFIQSLKNDLNNIGNINDLKKFYQMRISDISPELIDKLNKENIGGYIFSYASLEDGHTINEILHIAHHRIVNADGLYKDIPVIDQLKGEYAAISLRGKPNEVAQSIFDSLKNDKDIKDIDVLSLDNKIMIMARDIGHATSIEIDKEPDDNYMVKYFIPKINNVELINMISGIRKVNDNSVYTTGEFVTTKQEIGSDIFRFVQMVPKDSEDYTNKDEEILERRKQDANNELLTTNDILYKKYLLEKIRLIEEAKAKLEEKGGLVV